MYATAGTVTHVHQARRLARCHPAGRLSRAEILIATFALTATLCVALLPSITATVPIPSSTMTVRVSQHDTLWDLAKAHPVEGSTTAETVSLIRRLNGLDGSAIAAGEVLRVPAAASDMTALARR